MNPIFTAALITNLTKNTGSYIPKPPIKGPDKPNKDDKPNYDGWVGISLVLLLVTIIICLIIKK